MGTDYEKLYRTTKHALGPPGKLVEGFFTDLSPKPASVLDVGCGQGRDALFIARLGHRVTGVDLSPTGIADLNRAAKSAALDITGIVADITDWRPQEKFDVILFDRTLHMLAPPARLAAFSAIITALHPAGYVVIVDEKSNMPGLDVALNKTGRVWTEQHRKGGALIVRDTG